MIKIFRLFYKYYITIMNILSIIFYTLFLMLTWESNICFSFVYFIFVFIVYFNIHFSVILLYFIIMKMMKYDITLLLGDIKLKNLIAFTDSP